MQIHSLLERALQSHKKENERQFEAKIQEYSSLVGELQQSLQSKDDELVGVSKTLKSHKQELQALKHVGALSISITGIERVQTACQSSIAEQRPSVEKPVVVWQSHTRASRD